MSQTPPEDLPAEANDGSLNRPAQPAESPDTIDPVVDQWLQTLAKIAVAIATRENVRIGGQDAESN